MHAAQRPWFIVIVLASLVLLAACERRKMVSEAPMQTSPAAQAPDRTTATGGDGHGSAGTQPEAAKIVVPTQPTSPIESGTPRQTFLAESKKVEGLVRGSAALSAPAAVKQDEPFTVYLRVAPSSVAPLIDHLRAEHSQNKAVLGRENIKITPRMTARLTGFGVAPEPKDEVTHPVVEGEETNWEWLVKAEDSGIVSLLVTLTGTVQIEGKDVALSPVSYEQKVEVAVSPIGFVKKNWQWGFTALLIPAVGGALAAWRKRRPAAKPSFSD